MTTMTDRLIDALPRRKDYKVYTLNCLIELFSGEKVHRYYGWKKSGGFYRLEKALGVEPALTALTRASVAVTFGNDAPKGGATGSFIQLEKKDPRIVKTLTALRDQYNYECTTGRADYVTL